MDSAPASRLGRRAARQTAPAQAAVRKLPREFPCVEAAARAKEAWPALAAKTP